MTAQRLAADLAGKPAALTELANHLARRDPFAALPSLVDDEPATVLLLGLGAARYACEAAAVRLRRVGLGATAEFSSAADTVPAGPDTLVVAVSFGTGQLELCTALDRYVERSPIIVLTNDPEAPVARYADVLVPLLAGEEASGLACRGYQHALALLLLLAYRLGAVPPGATSDVSVTLRRVANASAELLERAREWLPAAAEALEGPGGVHFVAPAERLASAGQAAQAVRTGPVRTAHVAETGEWSHSDRYLAAVEDYRAVLFTGSHYDERVAEQLLQLRGSFVAVGGDIAGATATVRYLGDGDADVSLLTEPLVGELLAAHWWSRRRGRAR
ncbi:SIS domain-containing protein [Marinitenerispora sediminis]|uniref:Sugar isomerase n=1 Tax=Marinitenerispora sediminis TaxID=1931232 RepID=A0A368T0M8_9ACTN|nr:SIS domain-containing protein [Marinitenerispora sediminis]RCV50726.1 sugar isomerase [Marinitenerispora sediminis]RCV52581.1 sugar isomerase [Marinitenerispora sediminis]RCV56324.1 sugar isomerase [Marinitenerispora sediminis]